MIDITAFFDIKQFELDLSTHKNLISTFKTALHQFNEAANQKFCEGYDIRKLIVTRTKFIDYLLSKAWQQYPWPDESHIVLLAVGGYGRGELHPYSDIDILVLIDNHCLDQYSPIIEQFLMFLWDIGLTLGHSVRTLDECIQQATSDLTIITNLTEHRILIGSESLAKKLQEAIKPEHMWSSKDFLVHKFYEQQARHKKYGDTEYNLEPNIKESPGGLRDIHTILWIARREYSRISLHAMVTKGFITESEYRLMISAQAFLWKVRYALHMLTSRTEDRLLLELQEKVARLLGYHAKETKAAIEQLMKKYYRIAIRVSSINELIFQSFKEAILEKDKPQQVIKISEQFQVCNDFIEVTHRNVFQNNPSAILELFLTLGEHPEIWGIRANTVRLLYEYRYLIDEAFRHNPHNTQLFLLLLKTKHNIHRNLRRMSRYGILGRYLPAFGHIIGQKQYDLFHIYTVDAHTLNLIKHIRKLSRPDRAEKYPQASKAFSKLSKPELIYIAGLYHDIGKGYGVDHSKLGAKMVADFAKLHQLSKEDTKLVVWLVENHLVMSTTAQRKDLTDPQVINEFAVFVGNENYLNYLMVLTVSDINATNPNLWNSWRATLLRQLYIETKRALRRGLSNLLDRSEQIARTKQAALTMLLTHQIDPMAIEARWADVENSYFLRHSPADIAWHTEAIINHNDSTELLILIKEVDHTATTQANPTQIFIYAPDQNDFFATTVAIMDQLNLSIQDAWILTSAKHFTVDTFIVLNADGSTIGQDYERIETIRQALITGLTNPAEYPTIVQRRVSRQLKHFVFQPKVIIYNDLQRAVTIIQIDAPDRPGLLARIGQIFISFSLNIKGAKITTLGEKVEDIFLVVDSQGLPLTNEPFILTLRQTLIEKLIEQSQ